MLSVIPVHVSVLLQGTRTTAQTTIATVHRACLPPASYSTTTLLPSSSSSGHTLRVSMIVLRILLCVIQHCHCSSGAQLSVPTATAGRVLRACGRSALYAHYYCCSVPCCCCCQRHWPMHAYLPQCVRHFLLGTGHPRYVRRLEYNKNKSFVQASCTAAFAHTLRVSMIVLRILLSVIQHCHCSSCAQHSAPTAAAGRVVRM